MSGFTDAVASLIESQLVEFGVEATYTPAAGSPATISGLLTRDAKYLPDPALWGTLWVRLADLPGEPEKDDVITVAGVVCVLRGNAFKHKDANGGVLLYLRKQ